MFTLKTDYPIALNNHPGFSPGKYKRGCRINGYCSSSVELEIVHTQKAMANILLYFGYFDLTFSICTFIALLLWIRWRRPSDYPPGPTPLPIIGNFHHIIKADVFNVMRKLRKDYGDIFSLSLGKQWVTVINGKDNLREIFVRRGEVTIDRPSCFVFRQGRNKGIYVNKNC